MTAVPRSTRDVLLGVVIGATGLKGEVKVKTFTETPDKLAAYGRLHAKDGRSFNVLRLRRAKGDEAVAALEGITDRTLAEALKGTELFVSRAALPEAEPGEFYHADLVGLRAEDGEGRTLGTVCAIHNYGAGDVIEIARPDGDTLMLPFTREIVPEIHIAEGYVLIVEPNEIDAGGKGFVE